MDAANFKIAVELIDVGIRVKDLSPWGTDEREVNAFVVFHDAGTPGMVLDQPMFDSWSIELLVNSTVEAEVYGVPFWDRATTYKAGDIVYGKDYNETDSPFSPYAFYKCIQGGTGKFPGIDVLYWEKITSTDVATVKALFAALVADGNYTFYYDKGYAELQTGSAVPTKTSCYNYNIVTTGTGATNYALMTLEQYINRTGFITSWGTIVDDAITLNLQSYTDSDGNTYEDGIYVVRLLKGTESAQEVVEDVLIIEICSLVACYKAVVFDVLCSKCGCDDNPCTPDEIELDRKKRNFLNVFGAAFLTLLSYLNEDYAMGMNSYNDPIINGDALSEANMLITKLIDIKKNCNICS